MYVSNVKVSSQVVIPWYCQWDEFRFPWTLSSFLYCCFVFFQWSGSLKSILLAIHVTEFWVIPTPKVVKNWFLQTLTTVPYEAPELQWCYSNYDYLRHIPSSLSKAFQYSESFQFRYYYKACLSSTLFYMESA